MEHGMVILRAPRDYSDHWVGLEPHVLAEFWRWCVKHIGEEATRP
jgi:hypothetical protein